MVNDPLSSTLYFTNMKPRKLLQLYVGLLALAVVTMGLIQIFRALNKQAAERAASRDYDAIRREGVLRMVTTYGGAGGFVAPGDTTLQGFQYELCRALAQYAGIPTEMHFEMSLEASFDGLRRGRYDVVARGLPTTDELKAEYLFTDPLMTDRLVLVQRRDSLRPLVRNQLELIGRTLYVPRESPAILRLENLRREMADTFCIVQEPLYDSEQLIDMVAAGDIDYTVCDRQTALRAQARYPTTIDIETDIGFTQLHAWALRRSSPALRDSLNAWLRRMRRDGTFSRIRRKYYPEGE